MISPCLSVSVVVCSLYMIAVGGAGSSGLPALASGTRIITTARITSTMNPDTTLGCCEDHRQRPLLVLEDRNHDTH